MHANHGHHGEHDPQIVNTPSSNMILDKREGFHPGGQVNHDKTAHQCIALATSLLTNLYKPSLENLDRVVSLLRQVLNKRTIAQSLYWETVHDLVSALTLKFMYANAKEDLEESLALRRKIREKEMYIAIANSDNTEVAPGGQKEDQPPEVVEMAARARRMIEAEGFKNTTSLEGLNYIISLLRTSLDLGPVTESQQFVALMMLIDSLYARYHHLHDLADLNDAISYSRTAAEYDSQPQWRQVHNLHRICNLSATRYDFTGDAMDLQRALFMFEAREADEAGTTGPGFELVELAPYFLEDSLDIDSLNDAITLANRRVIEAPISGKSYVTALNDLSAMLRIRFEQSGQKNDFELSIIITRLTLSLRPPPNPDRSFCLTNLANALLTKFHQDGRQSDLDEAISLFRQSLELGGPSRPVSLSNLAAALDTRYAFVGQQSDLEEAISLGSESLDADSSNTTTLNNLANSLWNRFFHSGQMDDLEKAILLNRRGIELCRPANAERLGSLHNNLANALWTRFGQLGKPSDLDEAISLNRQALELRPFPHHNRSSSLRNLASVLTIRFEQTGQSRDLDEAIMLHRHALGLRPSPHPERHTALDGLASALFLRFKDERRERDDLEEAISLHRQALELQPVPHSSRHMTLNNLANALTLRSKELCQSTDLDEATTLLRQAIDAHPPPHLYHSQLLHNLATTLCIRIKQQAEPGQRDIAEAMSCLMRALKLQPVPHPQRSATAYNLANLLMIAHFSNSPNCVEPAMSLYSMATHDLSQSASRRLYIAKVWIKQARKACHASEFDGHIAALQALPQVAALSFDIQSRQHALTAGSYGLALDASVFAIKAGRLDKAVEFLEAGRAVFWTQALALRSPFDHLHDVAPELADKLRDMAIALERGSYRDVSPDMSDHRKNIILDQETSQMNRLNELWAKAIDEVRCLEGFEDFLQSRPFSSLQAAASAYPIIILVSDEAGGHCLVMTSTTIDHIPLEQLTSRRVRELVNLLGSAISQSQLESHPSTTTEDAKVNTTAVLKEEERAIRPHAIDNQASSDDVFGSVMRVLWNEVVKPVIDFLQLQKTSIGEMPILQWCPTGPFTFLPIHAAGHYGHKSEQVSDCAFDYFISSYTPTIGALLTADDPSHGVVRRPVKMMAVIQSRELPSTQIELEKIEQHVPSDVLFKLGVSGAPATIEEVASRLSDVSIVHFACHGRQDRMKPLKSGVLVEDGVLQVSRIMKEVMPSGSLAFLSACETAMGDQNLPDEAISLATSLLFSGFRRVVATMWEMNDADGPVIADAFYEEIFQGRDQNEPDFDNLTLSKSARALHIAVASLRSEKISFRRWVPFIHMGR